MRIDVDQKQLQDIIKKASPELIKIPLEDLMKEVIIVGEPIAREGIRGGTETAIISIGAKARSTSAQVYTAIAKDRAMSIEEGRPPGQPPSLLSVARWTTKRRYLTSRRLSELSKYEQAQVREAQDAIRTGGAKGKFFLKSTKEVIEKAMPGFLRDFAKKIEGRWKA